MCLTVLTACGSEPTGDAGRDGAMRPPDGSPVTLCARDRDCDNGSYCDGAERCLPGTAEATANGCVAGTPPCGADETCDEAADQCVAVDCTGGPNMNGDLDGDHHKPFSCGGGDCDDSDGDRFPDNLEVCDLDDPGHDEDCDPTTYGFRDIDMDGAPDARCFNIRESDGMRFGGTDCDDNNSSIHPLATERCDGEVDEDCDGMVDEGCPCTPEGSVRACGSQVGECIGAVETCTALGWSACTPAAATELCDGSRDDDCDGTVDEGCGCVSGTTRPCGVGACAVAQQTCIGGVWDSTGCPSGSPETCNGVDDNCDGMVDNVPGLGEACGSSVGPCRRGIQMCVGGTPALVCGGPGYVGPIAETCDHQDQDCDGRLDNGAHAAACTRTYTSRFDFDSFRTSGPLGSPTLQLGRSSGTGNTEPTGSFLRGWTGDLGRSSYYRLRAQVRRNEAVGATLHSLALVLTTARNVGPERGLSPGGLPVLPPGGHTLAVAFLGTGMVLVWEDASGVRESATVGFGTCSRLRSMDDRQVELELTLVNGTVVARGTFEGCPAPVTISRAWVPYWSELYGLGSDYPRFHLAAIGDNPSDVSLLVTQLHMERRVVTTSDRNNCQGCPP